MAAAMALGGFTGPEADTLGYAIRKKKSSVLRAQKEKFVSQAAERGVTPGVIDAVFTAFEPFERYGFNKAHATCYGLIAYQTAFMKANHTVDYMAAVLTAFRANEEKVAAAVAECRRMGIEVRPPDVHASHLEFTVEGDAIRFGLLAVKNVGQGAIESIIAARAEGGEFRSLTDFCTRIDLRLANRKVLEALIKVGALRAFGHAGQLLLGLDDAIAAAQATQRDRITGQTSLFDLSAADAQVFERPLPAASEVPVRERLRWEKELLGLYLSEHPMGEVAEQVGRFVNAYSGDLKDETLDGQRVVVGGIITGQRTVITKRQEAMAIVTLEDLQGSIEVVVFPRLYETTRPLLRDGAILLIAGRVDHKGEEVSLLADLIADWDDAAARGPEEFARDVSAGDRGGRNGSFRRTPVAVGPGAGVQAGASTPVAAPAFVSPRRAGENGNGPGTVPEAMPRIQPGEPVPTYLEAPGAVVTTDEDPHDEPAVPDEVRARIVGDATADAPVAAGPEAVLHVRFEGTAGPDRLVRAMETVKLLLKDRPGGTKVVLHVPAPGGGQTLPMELRWGVAYDAELLAEVRRQLGDGLVELRLASN
jgi:DNA polymerase III subunit alpha